MVVEKDQSDKEERKPDSNLERLLRIISLPIALLTFLTLLREQLNPQGIHWLIFVAYFLWIIAIVAWFMFSARKQERPLWEYVTLVCVSIVNTALFVLWLPSWFNEIKCDFYAIQINSPKTDAVIEGTFMVNGSYRFLPPPDSLILLNEAVGEAEYWPSSAAIQVNETLQTWRGEFYLSGATGSKANVDIALVGRSGRAIYEYYLKVGDNTGQWPSIRILPDDTKICDTVRVTRK